MIYRLPRPKAINHDQLIAELGFPCSLHLDNEGKCVAVQVQSPYYTGFPPVEHFVPNNVDVLNVVKNHVATPRAPDAPSELDALRAKLGEIEAKQADIDTRLKAQEEKLIP